MLALLCAATLSLAAAPAHESADPARYLQDVKVLTAPRLEGRGVGSKGLARAQPIIAHHYASPGLEPKGSRERSELVN
jgi:hypothetical protein